MSNETQVEPFKPAGTCYIRGMDLKERILAAVKDGKALVEAERERRREFNRGWEEKAKEVKEEAKAAGGPIGQLSGLGWGAYRQHNSCATLAIGTDPRGERAQYEVLFCPDVDRGLVVCRTSPSDLLQEETYSLDALTLDVIHDKFVAFLKAIYEEQAAKVR